MTSKEIRAEVEKSLDFALRLFDETDPDLDKTEAFDRWTLILSIYPDTHTIGAILAAALIRLKKLEARVQDSKDMSIERDLSE